MINDEIVIVNGQDTGEGKWSQHPELLRRAIFRKVDKGPIWYVANVDGAMWTITLNDFPDEPAHTVFIDDKPIMSFNNWPEEIWSIENGER